MKIDKHLILFLIQTNFLKSVYFNLHYLPLKQAVKLPIFISWRFNAIKLKGKVQLIEETAKHTGAIRIGYLRTGTQDTRYDRTKWDVDGIINFHGKASIGRGCSICVGGIMDIGNDFRISGASTIICKKQITIGNQVLLSWDCLVMDTDFHAIYSYNDGRILNYDKPITINDKVWIGCRSIILKGASIPAGCVIAASSVITTHLTQENCIYGGTKGGEILKESIIWKQ